MNGLQAHLVLLLMVVHEPSDQIVVRAATSALVAPFVEAPEMIVREIGAPPDPALLARLRDEAGARVAVMIACEGADCLQVALAVSRDGQSFARTLHFGAEDAFAERGRAAGLLASTLLPEDWSRRTDAIPGPPAATSVAGPLPAAPLPAWIGQLDAGFFRPTSGTHADVSLSVGVRRRVLGGLQLGVMARFERGGLEVQPGDFLGAGGAASLVWLSTGLETGHFGYGARVDLLAVRRRIRHHEATLVETHDYWAFGGDAEALFGLRLSTRVALLAGLGLESLSEAFASQEDSRSAHALSQYRFLATLGVLTRF